MPHPPRKESRNASEARRGVQDGIAIWNMAFQEWVQLFPSGMKNELRLVRFPPLRSGKRKPVRRFPRPRKVTPIVPIAGAVQWAARSRQAHRNNRTVRPLSRKRFRKTARSGAVAEETGPIGCFSRLPCPHSGWLLQKVEMRPRSARLVGVAVGVAEGGVSIHARTGRATGVHDGDRDVPVVSIHARTGRATSRPGRRSSRRGFNSRAHGARDTSTRSWCATSRCFNSRAHGARDGGDDGRGASRRVSIHARTGRAICSAPRPAPDGKRFNSRAHEARDAARWSHRSANNVSIHARTGRATDRCADWSYMDCFNSRAHGARDFLFASSYASISVSIHARTGRATRLPPLCRLASMFQFTRARGARPFRQCHHVRMVEFQFTRARGARHTSALTGALPHRFQFTRARGARLGVVVGSVSAC